MMVSIEHGSVRYDIREIAASQIPKRTAGGHWADVASDLLLRLEVTEADKALVLTFTDDKTASSAAIALKAKFKGYAGPETVKVAKVGRCIYVSRGPKWSERLPR